MRRHVPVCTLNESTASIALPIFSLFSPWPEFMLIADLIEAVPLALARPLLFLMVERLEELNGAASMRS